MNQSVELRDLRAFLAVAEELHFARAADRLDITPSRVSQTIATLETRLGLKLFERTSRSVSLTPGGERFREHIAPAIAALAAAFDEAAEFNTSTAGGLRIAFTATTEGPGLTRLVDVFSSRHPDCVVSLVEVSMADPYGALRAGKADVLYNWLAVDGPDLASSAPIEHQARSLAVGHNDPLARNDTVSTAEITDRRVPVFFGIPAPIIELFYPPPVLREAADRTLTERAGSPYHARSAGEAWALIARGQAVHATVASMASKLARDDIVLVPITDLPPLPLGLIWKRRNENARIRAFVTAAETMTASARTKPSRASMKRLEFDCPEPR